MFPVGLLTDGKLSSPIVKDGKVIEFYESWKGGRKFPVDMAEFAINVKVFLDNPDVVMPYKVSFEENGLLKALKFKIEDIEPKALNCTKVITIITHYYNILNQGLHHFKC